MLRIELFQCLAIPLLFAVGCGRRAEESPSPRPGIARTITPDELAKLPPPPRVAVIAPAEKPRIRPGIKFTCSIKINNYTLADSPRTVAVELLKGRKCFGVWRASLKEKGSGQHVFEAELGSPEIPGRYSIRAAVIDIVRIMPLEFDPKSDKLDSITLKRIATYSPAIDLEVTK